jgi:HPt (histidine-containing phosphotransfer) domain-containing protein
MTTPRKYYDPQGAECSLVKLVRMEPEWAANQIRNRDQLEQHVAQLQNALKCILSFPVHSEPIGSAHAMRDIAEEALQLETYVDQTKSTTP